MTCSGVNWEAGRGLIQSEGASPPCLFPQQPPPLPEPLSPRDSLLSFTTVSSSSPTPLSDCVCLPLAESREKGERKSRTARPVSEFNQINRKERKEPLSASQQESSWCYWCCAQVLSFCSKLEASLCDCLPFEKFHSKSWRRVLILLMAKTSHL